MQQGKPPSKTKSFTLPPCKLALNFVNINRGDFGRNQRHAKIIGKIRPTDLTNIFGKGLTGIRRTEEHI